MATETDIWTNICDKQGLEMHSMDESGMQQPFQRSTVKKFSTWGLSSSATSAKDEHKLWLLNISPCQRGQHSPDSDVNAAYQRRKMAYGTEQNLLMSM